jgi:hypothetical protein
MVLQLGLVAHDTSMLARCYQKHGWRSPHLQAHSGLPSCINGSKDALCCDGCQLLVAEGWLLLLVLLLCQRGNVCQLQKVRLGYQQQIQGLVLEDDWL